MPKKKSVKVTKEILKKYPKKKDVGEEVVKFATRVFLIFGIFALLAASVDIYNFAH